MILKIAPAGLAFWFSIVTLIPLFLEFTRIDDISQRIRNDNAFCQPTLAKMLAYYSDLPSATCAIEQNCSIRTNCIISIICNFGTLVQSYWKVEYSKDGKAWKKHAEKKKVHTNE